MKAFLTILFVVVLVAVAGNCWLLVTGLDDAIEQAPFFSDGMRSFLNGGLGLAGCVAGLFILGGWIDSIEKKEEA